MDKRTSPKKHVVYPSKKDISQTKNYTIMKAICIKNNIMKMENKTYCSGCGSPASTIKVGFEKVCSQCGFIHGSYIDMNKFIGWVLAAIFCVLWMIS